MTEATDAVHGAEIANTPWQGGWSWSDPAHGEHFRRCNWCGSIHPDDLAAEGGFLPQWADRKYGWPHKFYVDVRNQEPERLFVVGASSSIPRGVEFGVSDHGWQLVTDLTDEQRSAAVDAGWDLDHYVALTFGRHRTHHAKFYTTHLADPGLSQQTRDVIQRGCGLRFDFAGGRVSWSPCT